MKLKTPILLAAILSATSGLALAGVSADEARQLGSTLTPIGAEKAANKDGSIPAYEGGLTKAPAGFKAGDGLRPDPFAGEKPQFSIDASSMDKHADKLTEGTKALLKNWNLGLQSLAPAIAHPDAAVPLVPYGETWADGERPMVMEEDYPAGLPSWMHDDGWAKRQGADDVAKRRNITINVPKGIVA